MRYIGERTIAGIRSMRLVGSLRMGSVLLQKRSELDSHADTTVVGKDTALCIHDFEEPVDVFGYSESIGRKQRCKIVSAVCAYDSPKDGKTHMLVMHQAILIPEMQHNLICPMQLRDNDVSVNDVPKYMVSNPTDNDHAIIIGKVKDGAEDALRIPLSLHGVASYFPMRKPTKEEWENTDDAYIWEMTAESPTWNPSDTRFQEQEDAMVDYEGKMKADQGWGAKRTVAALHSMPQQSQPSDDFGIALESTVIPDIWKDPERSERPTAKQKRTAATITSGKKQKATSAKRLAKNWGIGLEMAQQTIEATTQKGLRTILHTTLSRRFRTNDRQLRYRRLSHDVYTDTLESKTKSWHRQNRYAQIFVTRFGWTRVYPMKRKADAHEGLSLMFQRDGVPPVIIMDGSKEQTQGEFRKKTREAGVHVKQTHPHSPWQNAAEGGIRETKRGAGRKAMAAGSPKVLWDHCLELEALIRSNTALRHYELNGEVPETIMSGQTADISPFAEVGWYTWVMFWDMPLSFPDPEESLGRWLGPSLDIGPAMTSKILQSNGHIVHTQNFRTLSDEEKQKPEMLARQKKFKDELAQRLGDPVTESDLAEAGIDATTPVYERYEDDVDGTIPSAPDTTEVTPEDADFYVGAEVNLPFGGTVQQARVLRRARDEDGEPTGVANENPILDTRTYEVAFPDGRTAEFGANAIAEHMFMQCDPDGKQTLLLDGIVGLRCDEKVAVKKADRYVWVNGRRYHKKTTAGWEVCCLWKNGATSWEKLSDLKESYPIELAEYAMAKGYEDEPAFAWWINYVLMKRKRILAAVNKRYQKRTHKFGIAVPKSVQEAYALDQKNGNTLWRDAIAKEMKNVRVAFKILEDKTKIPVGYQSMEMHMVFDVKFEANFRRKARLVAGGHMVEAPAVMTYASVVSRETVRIALTVAALNDMEVRASDVQNAYLTAPCEEKIYTTLGPEFGEDQGKTALVVRALYGLASAGATFGRHIADCMRTLGYTPCKADADLWLKPMVRPDDGLEYYAYVLLYVDDCLAIGHDAEAMLTELDNYFQMKPGSIGEPDIYLGAKMRKVRLPNGVYAWSASSSKYVQEVVRNVENYLETEFGGRKLPRKMGDIAWPTNYEAETDESDELDSKQASYYQHLIGVLQWCVELGRVDVITETSTLASQMAAPRIGHLEAAFHVIGYLKQKHNARLVFDPSYPEIDHTTFPKHEWTSFYGDVQEAIPPNAPKPRGKDVDLRLYVDSDHAGDKLTRRSRTGFFILLNSALITWMSKKQPTIETSVFGAEFVAMKHGIETLRGIRYKLRMMGVPVENASYVYGDNMSVIHNTQRPESVLKKKSNSICYHAVRESVAMGECRTGHIPTRENCGDLATKIIMNGPLRRHLVSKLLHDIYDDHEDK